MLEAKDGQENVFMGFWFPLVFHVCILPALSKTSVRFLRGCCGSRERRDGLTSLSPAVYWAFPVTCWDIHLSSTPWMGPVSVVHPETIFLLCLTFKNSFLMLSVSKPSLKLNEGFFLFVFFKSTKASFEADMKAWKVLSFPGWKEQH